MKARGHLTRRALAESGRKRWRVYLRFTIHDLLGIPSPAGA